MSSLCRLLDQSLMISYYLRTKMVDVTGPFEQKSTKSIHLKSIDTPRSKTPISLGKVSFYGVGNRWQWLALKRQRSSKKVSTFVSTISGYFQRSHRQPIQQSYIDISDFTTRPHQVQPGGSSMAKRFTDTGICRKKWYRVLPPKLKSAWHFLLAECDLAGCWSIDLDALEFYVGEPISVDEMMSGYNAGEERIAQIDKDKLFILDFISFQYGRLSVDCKPHKPVLKRLAELRVLKGFPKGIDTLQEKEKEQEKEIKGECEGKIQAPLIFSSAKEFRKSFPILTIEQGVRDFGEHRFEELVEECFRYHTLDPKNVPRTKGAWAKKWFTWSKVQKNSKSKDAEQSPTRVLPSV